jgi:hypothetical protein
MGTIADFYVGRGATAEWVGSIAWDGDPAGIVRSPGGLELLKASTEVEFRDSLQSFLAQHADAVSPPKAWPWPWASSALSDRVYAFEGDRVWVTQPYLSEALEARQWFDPRKGQAVQVLTAAIVFPDMSAGMLLHVDAEDSNEAAYAMGGRR